MICDSIIILTKLYIKTTQIKKNECYVTNCVIHNIWWLESCCQASSFSDFHRKSLKFCCSLHIHFNLSFGFFSFFYLCLYFFVRKMSTTNLNGVIISFLVVTWCCLCVTCYRPDLYEEENGKLWLFLIDFGYKCISLIPFS